MTSTKRTTPSSVLQNVNLMNQLGHQSCSMSAKRNWKRVDGHEHQHPQSCDGQIQLTSHQSRGQLLIPSSLQTGKHVHSSQCLPGKRSLGSSSSRGCTAEKAVSLHGDHTPEGLLDFGTGGLNPGLPVTFQHLVVHRHPRNSSIERLVSHRCPSCRRLLSHGLADALHIVCDRHSEPSHMRETTGSEDFKRQPVCESCVPPLHLRILLQIGTGVDSGLSCAQLLHTATLSKWL